jgi:transcriptional regulator of acetoin/glycerol metabolism
VPGDEEQEQALIRVAGLARARDLIDGALRQAVTDAWSAQVEVSALARALGCDRSTVYRRFITPALTGPTGGRHADVG